MKVTENNVMDLYSRNKTIYDKVCYNMSLFFHIISVGFWQLVDLFRGTE